MRIFYLISEAVKRCRVYALTVFITYWLACAAGIFMAQSGNDFALSQRDKIVGKAVNTSTVTSNYIKGNNFTAAFFDFSGNLFMGAVPQTLLGFGIVIPYFTAAGQGWVGGIVSVDSEHKSRLKDFKSSFYYFFVLLLQYIPYSLAIGAGIKCGIELYNFNKVIGWQIWRYKIQRASLIDLGYVYILAIPLFFLASCFEFLSTWNV